MANIFFYKWLIQTLPINLLMDWPKPFRSPITKRARAYCLNGHHCCDPLHLSWRLQISLERTQKNIRSQPKAVIFEVNCSFVLTHLASILKYCWTWFMLSCIISTVIETKDVYYAEKIVGCHLLIA